MSDDTPTALGALQIDEGKLRGHVECRISSLRTARFPQLRTT